MGLDLKHLPIESSIHPISTLFPETDVYAIVGEVTFHKGAENEKTERFATFSSTFSDDTLMFKLTNMYEDISDRVSSKDVRIISILKCDSVLMHQYPDDVFSLYMNSSFNKIDTIENLMDDLQVPESDNSPGDICFIPFISRSLQPAKVVE